MIAFLICVIFVFGLLIYLLPDQSERNRDEWRAYLHDRYGGTADDD